MGTIPGVSDLQPGAQRWRLTSSLIPLQQHPQIGVNMSTSPPSSSASLCICYVLWQQREQIYNDGFVVIPFQLLICIESVPPGDTHQHVCSSEKECWFACHCHQAAVMRHF